MQELALQVNRPHGWGFKNVENGEIKYTKLWQVSGDKNSLCRGCSYLNVPVTSL